MSTQERAAIDLVAVQRRTVRTLVIAQAVGAIGITIGIATASLLARDISGLRQPGRARPDLPGARRRDRGVPAGPADVGSRPALRTGDRLPARRQWRAARRGRRRRRLDGVAARRRAAARIRDRGQQQRAVRRHRPRRGRAQGPGALDRGVGDHHRRGARAEPDRAGRRVGRDAGHPGADRAVRHRRDRDGRRRGRDRRPAAARPAAAGPRGRRGRVGAGSRHGVGARRRRVPRAPGAGVRGARHGLRARRDGRRDGDDARCTWSTGTPSCG